MSWQAAIGTAVPVEMRPMPRLVLSEEAWRNLGPALAAAGLTPAGLWADTAQVHALVVDGSAVRVLSVAVRDGVYPALSPALPGCARAERSLHDLFGHAAEGGIDARPLLDHGAWTLRCPMAPRPGPASLPEPPEFAGPEGAGQIGLGPQRGDGLPAAHLRLFVEAGRSLSAEVLTGYLHRGIPALLRGKSPRAAARFIARLDGRATIAHATAFARAAEAASDVEAPQAARSARLLLLALERVAIGLDRVIGRYEATPAPRPAPRLAAARAALVRAIAAATGHPLAMDLVVPGGVAALPRPETLAAVAEALRGARTALGSLDAEDRQVATLLAALRADADSASEALADRPPGPACLSLPPASSEGLGQAPGPFGDVWHWMRLDAGQIATAMPIAPALRPPAPRGEPPNRIDGATWRLAVPGLDL